MAILLRFAASTDAAALGSRALLRSKVTDRADGVAPCGQDTFNELWVRGAYTHVSKRNASSKARISIASSQTDLYAPIPASGEALMVRRSA
jgi:hypothetical protein